MSWRAHIDRLWTDAAFFPPPNPTLITRAEHALAIRFPADLIALFQETDGVLAHYATPYLFRLPADAAPLPHARYRVVAIDNLPATPERDQRIAALAAALYTDTHQHNRPAPLPTEEWVAIVFDDLAAGFIV